MGGAASFSSPTPSAWGRPSRTIKRQPFDIALLDLTLPDSSGLESLDTAGLRLPTKPPIVGGSPTPTKTNCRVKRCATGAQDLSHQAVHEQGLLVRALRYAIEPQKTGRRSPAERQRSAGRTGAGTHCRGWKRPTTSTAPPKSSSASTFKNASPWPRKPPRLILSNGNIPVGSSELEVPPAILQHPPTKGPEFGVGQWTWTVHPDDLEAGTKQELWQTIQDRHGFNNRVPHSGWE